MNITFSKQIQRFWSELFVGLTLFAGVTGAQTIREGPEDFRVEVTGSAWILSSGGHIQSNGAPIDLVSDLGVTQQQPTFFGELVFKPARKQRIVVEGAPFRLNGLNTVNRTLTYRNQTFNVHETLSSSANLNYFFAGYQYDVLSGSWGHWGLSAGGAYLSATGTILEVSTNTLATKSQTMGLPLAGTEFRVLPIRGRRILQVDGGIRGMAVGDYGHYAEGWANGGSGSGRSHFWPVTEW